ncbi:zinc ABC transporter ATP-binding protein [Domibacillus antri]|uniref:Zinc ABC transporter ATP-binding protein n=1 Tax=Domibacillus antri TaxID=1714264 RepID=A0A1Q8Q7Q9_9BACI|nr:metal ABC transporter ATP-binding protein [Domibacillus antri]OLN23374.1 zinc ABC transporter ATP-binding protein [Domibacillus antri]
MEQKTVIDIRDVNFKYDRENVLEDIHLSVPQGAFVGLVGPNGSGKSTLLKIILGLLKVKEGEVQLFGIPQQKFKDWDRIGFVSQKANSFNIGFPATVFEVVMGGLAKKVGLFRRPGQNEKEAVVKAVKAVGMEPYLNRNIGDLSGGQQQRVFIARAIVSNPSILILDEPTVGVDSQNVESFYHMLTYLNEELGMTLLLVTHDIGTITDKVTHVACLNKYLHFHGSMKQFIQLDEQELSHLYGHGIRLLDHHHDH